VSTAQARLRSEKISGQESPRGVQPKGSSQFSNQDEKESTRASRGIRYFRPGGEKKEKMKIGTTRALCPSQRKGRNGGVQNLVGSAAGRPGKMKEKTVKNGSSCKNKKDMERAVS